MIQPLAGDAPEVMDGAHPSATVVLLRDGGEGLEVLMVRRHAKLAFHGGAWVFPGGRIDESDYPDPSARRVFDAARLAAVREAAEEAGARIAPGDLIPISRWVTPTGLPKRFDTWFFVARAGAEDVRVDGSEIDDHRWFRPADAIAAQRRGEIELPPPTFVTLADIDRHRRVNEALDAIAAAPTVLFFPRMAVVVGGACTLYEGDSGYDSGEADQPGPRHRLWMLESGWRYERPDDE